MASFQPNGESYDGNGIEPEVLIDRKPGYVFGTSDAARDAALKWLLYRELP